MKEPFHWSQNPISSFPIFALFSPNWQ